MNIIVSTCGTSLLTNNAPEVHGLLLESANLRESELAPNQKLSIDSHLAMRQQELSRANLTQIRKMSAELNGLLSLYNSNLLSAKADMQYLLHTDTYQGEQTAVLIESWLRSKDVNNLGVIKIEGLNTKTTEDFRRGIARLVRWCDETLSDDESHSRRNIVFNLVGGFKSLQGYMQTLGMFYADETIYIFESGGELIRIPRLPVKFDVSLQQAETLREIAFEKNIPEGRLKDLPEALYMPVDGGRAMLSEWGEFVWRKMKKDFYAAKLHPPLSGRLRYSQNFAQQFESYNDRQKMELQEHADYVAAFLDTDDSRFNPQSVRFHALENTPYTHEFYPWTGQARRAFCTLRENVLVVERINSHL